MNIVALDPGLVGTGIAVFQVKTDMPILVDLHCILPKREDNEKSKALSDVRRIMEHVDGLQPYIEDADLVLVELPHGGAKSARATRSMALITGAVAAVVRLGGVRVAWFTPRETRMAAVGVPKADKSDIIAAMSKIYPELKLIKSLARQEHIADALATYEAGVIRGDVQKAVNLHLALLEAKQAKAGLGRNVTVVA